MIFLFIKKQKQSTLWSQYIISDWCWFHELASMRGADALVFILVIIVGVGVATVYCQFHGKRLSNAVARWRLPMTSLHPHQAGT